MSIEKCNEIGNHFCWLSNIAIFACLLACMPNTYPFYPMAVLCVRQILLENGEIFQA